MISFLVMEASLMVSLVWVGWKRELPVLCRALRCSLASAMGHSQVAFQFVSSGVLA